MRVTLLVALALCAVSCKSRGGEASAPQQVQHFGIAFTLPGGAEANSKAREIVHTLGRNLAGGSGTGEAIAWTIDSPDSMIGVVHQRGRGSRTPRLTEQDTVSVWPANDRSIRISKSTISKTAHMTTALLDVTNGRLTGHVKVFGGKNGDAWDLFIVECISVDDALCTQLIEGARVVDELPYLAL